jgi:hypothetical protein
MLCLVGLGNLLLFIFDIYVVVTTNVFTPWYGLDFVHGNFYEVYTYTKAELGDDYWQRFWIEQSGWCCGAVTVFLFIGTGGDALTEYKKGWNWVRTNVLRMKAAGRNGEAGSKPNGAQTIGSFAPS